MASTTTSKTATATPRKRTKRSRDTRTIQPALQETRWALVNLMNTYTVKKANDPSFTKQEWAKRSGLGTPTIVSRFLKQKSISLDNAVRLARPLGIGIDCLLQEPETYLREVLHVSPEEVGRKLLDI